MKNKMHYLFVVVLTICLVGFTFNQIIPASNVYAASEAYQQFRSAGPAEEESVPLLHSEQPIVFIVTGFVCILFGVIAVSPLLIDDPAQALKDTNGTEK